tara:strand:- start:6794 stop:7141 length:348 start_codon:yes stop_codon:yes gene_type:complete
MNTQSQKIAIACEAADSFLRFYFQKEIDSYDKESKSLIYTPAAQAEFDLLYDELMNEIEPYVIEDLSQLFFEEEPDSGHFAYKMKIPSETSVGLAWHQKTEAKVYLFKGVEYASL